GGMVICPGSLHPATKKAYSVYDNLPIADAPQWLKHYSLDTKIFKKTTKENKVALDIVRDENGVIDIEQLPLSDDIKEKIRTPFPEGQRSEPSWSVLLSLINHGMSEQDIRDIYSQNPIGDKAKSNPDWFNKEIEKAFKRKSAIDKPKKENPYDKMFCCSLDKIKNADMHFEYIIEGFWPKGENLLITGKGGSGKSLFALNMALDLALPGNNMFLDTFKINKPSRKIMFLQSENTVHGTKMRVKNILSKYRQYNSSISNIYFIGMDQDIRIFGNFKEDNMLRKKIGDFIESVKPDVIFIDPLISYHAANENSNDEMRQVLDDLSQFFSAFEVDICIIHHDSKTGTSHARGASAIMDWAANAYSIEKKESLYNLKHQKARNFSVSSDITLSFDQFKFLNFQGSVPGQSISQECLDILSVIDAEPNKSFSSQKDFFKKYQQKFGSKASSHSKFMKDTDVLIAQGLISETNQGKSKVYTRN
ncbi:MAG: AAA family ATPase, partial [Bacteroidota bacterium]